MVQIIRVTTVQVQHLLTDGFEWKKFCLNNFRLAVGIHVFLKKGNNWMVQTTVIVQFDVQHL